MEELFDLWANVEIRRSIWNYATSLTTDEVLLHPLIAKAWEKLSGMQSGKTEAHYIAVGKRVLRREFDLYKYGEKTIG